MTRMVDSRDAYRILLGRPDGKTPLGRPRRKWKDNIKMGLQEMGCGHGLDCSGAGYGHVAGACDCGNEPTDSVKCGEFLD